MGVAVVAAPAGGIVMRWKRWWPDLNEDLPLDVLPASNGEFIPKRPSAEQLEVMRLANDETERWRRKLNMSRRDFVRTAGAMAIGFWALDQVTARRFGRVAGADDTATTEACDLEFATASGIYSLANMPGEFIFDVQSHHVESDGMWRVTNPGFQAFFAAIWGQAGMALGGKPGVRADGSLDPSSGRFVVRGGGAGELDPIENLSRYHYLKELFLDSATTMTVLSAVPAAPDITQPLPIERAALTVQMVNELAGSQRTVMHAFVMPNRGSAGTVASTFGREPVYMQREFEIMEERAVKYRSFLRGWKTYPAWGDVPYSSGWFFDDPLVGIPFVQKVIELSNKFGVPPNIATHKGFALPGFDQRGASPRDIGVVARMFPQANFIVYHSGYDGETMAAYPGDDKVNSANRSVNALIKSLRENNWDATHFGAIPAADAKAAGVAPRWANVPNVYAEIGSTWRSVMGTVSDNTPNSAAHLLGKLITYVGPKRICWGTDSLWFGSPQSEIAGLRRVRYEHSPAVWDSYGLPHAIDGDADDPTVDTRVRSNYTSSHPNASKIAEWPTDGNPHPERSIRNWIFGRAAAQVYRVNIDDHMRDRDHIDPVNGEKLPGIHQIKCDDVQKIRDGYILNQMTPKEQAPMASNTVIGPRTRRELFTMRAEGPWGP